MRSKVRGKTAEFIETVAANDSFKALYGPLPAQSKGRTLDSFLFGILTATERTEAAERALKALKVWGYTPEFESVKTILQTSGIVYYTSKARYVCEFIDAFANDPEWFSPQGDEKCSEYRDRIYKRGVLGLGFIKTNFACYLAYGGGDVICPDRHIINLYLGERFEEWMMKRSKKAEAFLRSIESHFCQLANKYGWQSASALQWAVWCEATDTFFSHAVVSE